MAEHFEVGWYDMEDDELLSYLTKIATNLKDKGNDYYKCGKYPEALKCYKTGLLAIDGIIGIDDNTLAAVLHKNNAAVYLKMGHYLDAYQSATLCLKLTPADPKALYRRAEAKRLSPTVPKATGYTNQLHKAVQSNQLEKLKNLLVQDGWRRRVNDTDGERGYTPFRLVMKAKSEHQLEMAEILLRHGADMFVPDSYGETLMQQALRSEQHDMVRLLLEHGHPVDEPDCMGRTLIMVALGYGEITSACWFEASWSCVRPLLEAGASLSTVLPFDPYGQTVLDWAEERLTIVHAVQEVKHKATVPSLLDLCHKNIRKQLGSRSLHPKIERLKLPKKLTTYLKKLTDGVCGEA